MKTISQVLTVLMVTVLSAALVAPVKADYTKETCTTQYGGATECKKETIKEEVTHDTSDIQAGLGEDLMAIAGISLMSGLVLFTLSKVTRRAYWLD